MIRLAVVGADVSRSLSPAFHTFLMREHFRTECSYEKVSIPERDFHTRIEEFFERYDGLNVTVPYKEEILSHLHSVEGVASELAAVNTVLTKARKGFNTDEAGFSLMLLDAGMDVAKNRVLVLGAGGAGRSVAHALVQAGANVYVYEKNASRLGEFHRRLPAFTPLKVLPEGSFDLVINCTGVGSRKTEGTLPTVRFAEREESAESILQFSGGAVDLIYEPPLTEFLRVAKGYGKPILSGEGMLFFQAYYADCIFLGEQASEEEARALYRQYKDRENT